MPGFFVLSRERGLGLAFAPQALKATLPAGVVAGPLWNLLDITREGRGEFFPKVW
jgi:hypothetical protein